MTDLADLLAPGLLDALTELVDQQVAVALAAQEQDTGPRWLSIEGAAAYVGVSPATIARRIASGKLRSTTIGRRRIIDRADLDAYLRDAATRRSSV